MLSYTVLILIAATAAVMGLHAARLMQRNRWNAFDPVNAFWGGVLVVYIMQPLSQGTTYESWHAQGIMERACFWILVAICSVVIGYESQWGQVISRKIPAMPKSLDASRMQWIAYITIGVGVLGYLYQFASAGGFENWEAIGRGGTNWHTVSIYLAQLADLLPLGITLLLFEVEMHIPTSGKRLFAWSLGGGMLLWLFYLGSRSRTIAFAWVLIAAYYVPRRRNPSKVALAVCGFVLVIAAEFLGQYRDRFTNLSFNIGEEDVSSIEERILPSFLGGNPEARKLPPQRGAEFNCVMGIVEVVPQIVPYDGGHALLELLTRPIPRALWPEKRYPGLEFGTPILEAADLGGDRVITGSGLFLAGPAFTFVGYWYGIGGPLALVIMGFLTGIMFRTIRGLYDRGGEANALLYIVLAPIGFSESAATPLDFVYSLPFTLLPLLLFIRLCRERPPRRGAARKSVAVPRYSLS